MVGWGGEIAIDDCWMTGNNASGAAAGWNSGPYVGGEAGGGAVLLREAVSTLVGSTLSANTAEAGAAGRGAYPADDLGVQGWGGGIAVLGGSAALTNCTLSGNLALGAHGGAYNDVGKAGGGATGGGLHSLTSAVLVVHCTLAGNRAVGGAGGTSMAPLPGGAPGTAAGGGFHAVGGTLTLRNSLSVGNTTAVTFTPSDGFGTVVSLGRNAVGTDAGILGLSNADLKSVAAKLGALQDHGGAAPTHALLRGSAAIDVAGPDGVPATDQRGFPRPSGPGPDIGAFERGPEPPPMTTIHLDGQAVASGGTVTHRGPVEVFIRATFEGGTLLYTLDGSTPTFESTLYRGPFVLTNDARIRAFAYDGEFSTTTPIAAVDVTIAADDRHALILTTSGEGSVTVTPSEGPYDPGTVVHLAAHPANGWRFAGWSGDAVGQATEVELSMDAARTVAAEFVPWALYPLSVSKRVKSGIGVTLSEGWGWVELDPPGGMYPSNTLVTLTAVVPQISFAAGHTGFSQWTGDATGPSSRVTLRMDRPRSVMAEFRYVPWGPGRFWLNVAAVGGGIVVATPPSEDLPVYYWGTPAVITAVPTSGWSFLHWTGNGVGTVPTTTVGLGRDSYVEAVFGTPLRTVASGAGTIEVSPDRTLHPGEAKVRLLAIPAEGHAFARWGNAVSGTNNPIELTVRDAEPTVAALFVPLPQGQVSLLTGIAGEGEVRVEPPGNRFPAGTQVRVTAEPKPGQVFLGWSGDAAGTEASLELTLDRSRLVRALFTQRPRLSLFESFDYRSPQSLRLRVEGEDGAWYSMESSSNLTTWARFNLVTNLGGATVLTGPQSTPAARYYRAVRVGP
jgi:hypothetical protein